MHKALTKYSPYIEKLSKLLMEVSRTTPLFKEIGRLYLRSKRIQDSLFEYYIIVVRLCQELYSLSQTNTMGQLWTAFSEESYQKQLEQWSQAIQTEVYLETVKLAKEESKKSIAFRSSSQKHMALQRQQQRRDLRQRILDACSQHNYRTIWKQTRKLGNTMLFAKATGYQNWISTASSCTLLYSGKLGSGKSVLLANIVDDLYLTDSISTVAYFFCRYDTADSLEPRTIIGCLARQVLQRLPDVDALEDKIEESSFPNELDLDELLQFIRMSVTKPVHFVLDGIDDLGSDQRCKLLDSIYDLQQEIPLLVCISARSPQDVFHGTKCSDTILYASIPQVNLDIEVYINNEIDYRLAGGTLLISDNELVQEVKEKLIDKSQGMFLWVYLQIINLSSMASDFEVRECLSDLPDGIAETYNRLLQDGNHIRSQHRLHLLELILVAYQPLRTEELREALSVEPGVVQYSPAKLLNSIDGIIRSCKGLVMVDEEETTVRLVHFSARQFLTSHTYKEKIKETLAQSRMSEIILTYLNYSVFESQLTLRKPQTISSSAIPAALLIKAIPAASKIVRISQNSRLDRTLANAGKTVKISNSFKGYALNYWDKHLTMADVTDCCLEMLDAALSTRRIDPRTKDDQLTPLQLAVIKKSLSIVGLLLKHNAAEDDKMSALSLAAAANHSEIIEMLLKEVQEYGVPFRMAIDQEDRNLMMILLRQCTRDDLNCSYSMLGGRTPLMYAIWRRSYSTIRLLLANPKIDPSWSKPGHLSPFFMAIDAADLVILELLADVVPIDQGELWGALIEPCDESDILRSTEMVSFLLQRNCLHLRYNLRWPMLTPLDRKPFSGPPTHCYPLVYLVRRGYAEKMKVVLDFDPTIVNESAPPDFQARLMKTPYDYANSDKSRELLAQYGGKSWKDLH